MRSKRFLSATLAVAVALSALFFSPVKTDAEEIELEWGTHFEITDAGVLLFYSGDEIPDYGSKSDTPWNDRVITSVYMEDMTFRAIGNHAFEGLSEAEELFPGIPDTVTRIGDYAFAGCQNLPIGKMPDNLTTVGAYAFDGCKKTDTFDFPMTLTSIGEGAFRGCGNGHLSVAYPEGTTVGDGAFANTALAPGRTVYRETLVKHAGGREMRYTVVSDHSHTDGNLNENGACTVCALRGYSVLAEPDPAPVFSGAALALGQDLSLRFFADAAPYEGKTVTVRFDFAGRSVEKTPSAEDDSLRFDFLGIAPQQMGEPVTATLIADGEEIGSMTYSILDYYENMRPGADGALADLLDALILYGAAAEEYRGVSGERRAADLAGRIVLDTAVPDGETRRHDATDAAIVSAVGVRFGVDTRILFRLSVSDLTGYTLELNGAAFSGSVVREGDVTVVSTPAVSAAAIASPVTLSLLKDGVTVESYRFGIGDFVIRTERENGSAANLARALYTYGVYAAAYRTEVH